MTSYGEAIIRMLVALAIVSAMAYLVIRFGLKRWMPNRPLAGHLKVIDRLPLSARQSLCLVQVGARLFLVGLSEQSIQHLAELSDDDLEKDDRIAE